MNNNCVHPHIFRMQRKDPYRCLACGEVAKVEFYEKPAPTTIAATADEPEHDLWHMLEVDKKDIHVLHVSGCNSEGKNTDPKCRVMLDLINNKPSLAIGEYNAYANGSEPVRYEPHKVRKVTQTKQRIQPL